MAVFTEVDARDLEHFWGQYDLGEVESLKGIAEGVENSNFFVETAGARYILTLFEKRVAEDDLPYFVGLMDHVAQAGFACPQPMWTKSGHAIGRLSGRPALVTSFLPGLAVRRPSVADCTSLGQALGRFHEATNGFDGKRPNNLSRGSWQAMHEPIAEAVAARNQDWARLAEESLQKLHDDWPAGLPMGHIHADLFPDNVFFRHGEVSGFIDFYFACEDMLAYDLAICINAWCFEGDGSLNVTKSAAFLNSYSQLRPLDPSEKEALPLLALGAAVRFFLTRAHDVIHHDPSWLVTPKDPNEYAHRMRTHLRARSAQDYGLWS